VSDLFGLPKGAKDKHLKKKLKKKRFFKTEKKTSENSTKNNYVLNTFNNSVAVDLFFGSTCNKSEKKIF
jgi:hypothetical protein